MYRSRKTLATLYELSLSTVDRIINRIEDPKAVIWFGNSKRIDEAAFVAAGRKVNG